MRADRRILGLLCACVFGGLAACSEPEENITGSPADGLFALRMEAEKNWVHAEDVLPIRVTLESQTGAFLTERTERVEFLVNNGSVSPSSLTFTFEVQADPLGRDTGDTSRSDWITFTADHSVTASKQGEVIALFEDLQVTYKIRFVEEAE